MLHVLGAIFLMDLVQLCALIAAGLCGNDLY